MTEYASTLYAKLLGETAQIGWLELQPFFARGQVLWVDAGLDLVEVAVAVAQDDHDKVSAWLQRGQVSKIDEARAQDCLERDPDLWVVVVSPWVLAQERVSGAPLH